jgi:uncharacterized protein YjbI with pentapeptide repeats
VANPEHLAKLNEGVEAWNEWRKQNRSIDPDLSRADLSETHHDKDLIRSLAKRTFLNRPGPGRISSRRTSATRPSPTRSLRGADLNNADLRGANLSNAILREANLSTADLSNAILRGANLRSASLSWTTLGGANLSNTILSWANLSGANLSNAILREADLRGANLDEAIFSKADLRGAFLSGASMVKTNFEDANLTGCLVYGTSVWDVRLEGAIQTNLVITPTDQSVIQVDNLEVAQFVYLLLNNAKIRDVIDTIGKKAVLILGRFTSERKAVLDSIREALRHHGYLPILFDFEKPSSKDLTGTVSTLANLARFIIADLTEPSSVTHELATLAPTTVVPVQAILLEGQREYAMFPDLVRRYHWVLEPYQYKSLDALLDHLNERVIAPAEAKTIELRRKVAATP